MTRLYFLYLQALFILGFLTFFTFASSAQSQKSRPSSSVSVSTSEVIKEESKFSISATMESRSNLYKEEAAESSRESSLELTAAYKISPTYKIGINGAVSKPWTDKETKAELSNILFYGSHAAIPLFGDNLKLTPSLGLFAPTNKTSSEDQKFRGGVDLKSKFAWNINTLGIDALYSLGLRKDVYEFTTDKDNKPLVSYKITHGLGLSKSFLKKFSADLAASYQTARDFDNRLYTKFILDESLSYTTDFGMSFSLGHTNLGNALQYDGKASNIKAYSQDTSTIYGAITITN